MENPLEFIIYIDPVGDYQIMRIIFEYNGIEKTYVQNAEFVCQEEYPDIMPVHEKRIRFLGALERIMSGGELEKKIITFPYFVFRGNKQFESPEKWMLECWFVFWMLKLGHYSENEYQEKIRSWVNRDKYKTR